VNAEMFSKAHKDPHQRDPFAKSRCAFVAAVALTHSSLPAAAAAAAIS
jgi:hypothetical protein